VTEFATRPVTRGAATRNRAEDGHAGAVTPASADPVSRLSVFDGSAFHPVEPGSVDATFVHVFVHGWQPGYRVQERLLAATDQVAAVPAWDPRLVDATGRPLIADYLSLLQALTGLGPEHAVLWYSWLDESATDADVFLAYRSRQATQVNGRRLAIALQRAAASDRAVGSRERLHLIGHSHGSAVVTHAAVSLRHPPEHLTLLDAPEDPISRAGGASDLIDVVLPRLRPGRRDGRTFVDSYASAFGRPYHRRPGLADVVDVLLTPPLTLTRDPVRAINAVHLYPVEWYARSIREPERGVGYSWSPLSGGDPTQLRASYRAAVPLRPMDLRPRMSLPADRLPAWLAGRLTGSRTGSRTATVRDTDSPVRLSVAGPSPEAAAIVVTQPGDRLLEFDLEPRGCDGTERLEIELDGMPAFAAHSGLTVPSSGRYVMLADGRAGQHLLGARLEGGDPDARVVVTNVRVVNRPRAGLTVAPEHRATTLFGAGAVAGAVATLIVLAATGLTAHRVLVALGRRRSQ
jgi:hypothetical protein